MVQRLDRAAVKNAADREQVKHAAREQKDDDERRMDNLRVVMALREGREHIWDLLEDAGIYESVVAQEPEMTYYNAGRQDSGHRLLANVLRADADNYIVMEQEHRARVARKGHTAQAVQQRDKSEELQ